MKKLQVTLKTLNPTFSEAPPLTDHQKCDLIRAGAAKQDRHNKKTAKAGAINSYEAKEGHAAIEEGTDALYSQIGLHT